MIRFLRHIFVIALFIAIGNSAARAQGGFVEIDTTFSKKVNVRPTEHLLGVRYSYEITGVHFAPDLKAEQVHTYKNYAILYTYYHNLWDVWSYFGIQFGAKYCQYGFTSYYNIDNMDQTLTAIEVPLVTQLKYDVGKHLRLMLDIGGFAGYRLSTDNPKGFDQFDQRWDYGAQGGGGVALKFHPFELHFEVLYQYSFAFLYHPEKLSTDWWLYSYPNRISFNFGLFFNFD
jgi:hypothetical protein